MAFRTFDDRTAASARQSLILAVAIALAGVALAMTFVVASVALARIVTGAYGATGDFISYWAAGYIVRTGDGAHLYDPVVHEFVERAHFAAGFENHNAYISPVFVAWCFAPFTWLPFRAGFLIWIGCNVALLLVAVRMLDHELAAIPTAVRRTFLAVFALSMPSVAVILFGQVDLIILIAALGACVQLRRGRDIGAGLALSVLLMKPQMLVGFVLMLIVLRRWRALGALAAVGGPLLIVPALLTAPSTLLDNVGLVGQYAHANKALSVNAEMMSNWRGFLVSATGRSEIWIWLPGLALIAVAALVACAAIWRRTFRGEDSLEHALAAAVMLPLVSSPHLHTQSLVLMFIPIAFSLRARFTSAAPQAETTAAITVMLYLFAALFALWFVGTLGLALMVFLVLAVFWRVAANWPQARRASAIPSDYMDAKPELVEGRAA